MAYVTEAYWLGGSMIAEYQTSDGDERRVPAVALSCSRTLMARDTDRDIRPKSKKSLESVRRRFETIDVEWHDAEPVWPSARTVAYASRTDAEEGGGGASRASRFALNLRGSLGRAINSEAVDELAAKAGLPRTSAVRPGR